jgi:hypothetical protein
MIMRVISALQRNCMEIFSCESDQQTPFDDAPEPKALKEFLDGIEIGYTSRIE